MVLEIGVERGRQSYAIRRRLAGQPGAGASRRPSFSTLAGLSGAMRPMMSGAAIRIAAAGAK